MDDFEEINDHEGGSIMSKMKKGFNQLGRTIRKNDVLRTVAKAGIVAGATAGGAFLGGPLGGFSGGVAGELLTQRAGLGVKKDLRKIGKVLKKGFKAAKPTLRAVGRELRPIAQELYNDSKAHAIQSLKSNLSNTIQNDYMPQIANNLDHYTGDSYYGDKFYDAGYRALESQGMGIRVIPRIGHQTLSVKGRMSKKLPTPKTQMVNEAMADAQQYQSVGGVVQMSPAEKMVHNTKTVRGGSLISDVRRGFKKIPVKTSLNYVGGSLISDVRGGFKKIPVKTSMRYLGGSMLPLGR
jgi:hypothetical protein